MPGVFLSYRRQDAAGHAGRLYDRLVARYGRDSVFMDLDSIGPGVDWVDRIEQAVRVSDVMLAIIGRGWLEEARADGRRRLNDPGDVVRAEIAAALKHGLTVVPVLVQGAQMPAAAELPEDLAPLARRNAFELADARWRADVEDLLEAIGELAARSVAAGERATGSEGGGYRLKETAGGPAATVAASQPRSRRPAMVRFRQMSSWGTPLRVAAPLGTAALALVVVVSSGALTGGGSSGPATQTNAAPGASAPATTPASARPSLGGAGSPPGARRCRSGPGLSGRLVARHLSCATAVRVTLAYLARTRSGVAGHSGPARIDGFRCAGRVSAHATRVSCRHGRSSVSFVGAG